MNLTTPAAGDLIGQRLAGRYEIVRELGRGGMGAVYLANDPVLDREVAVKVVPADRLTPEAAARLQREARVVARLDHPGIISVFDFAPHEQAVFFVMPVVRGASLRTVLGEGRLGFREALDACAQVAAALDYSHRSGVIHRDIKPENVMVLREGGRLRVKVMDFGIAIARTDTRMTSAGTIVGTLAYLAPEQLRGDAPDERSDVYSLGVLLFECLAGRPPFEGNWESVMFSIVHEPPPSLRSLGVEVPAAVEELVLRCLSKAPRERPGSAGELAEALRGEPGRRLELPPVPGSTPLVGRERELAELLQRLDRSRGGECHLVLLGGEPGLGKTRLLAELEAVAQARGVRAFHGRFVERSDPAFPFQALCEVIQEALRAHPAERPDLGDLLPELGALFPMLAEAGAPLPPVRLTPGPDGPPGPALPRVAEVLRLEHRTAVFELLARTLARVVAGRPAVLLLEGLHAADISVEALQYAFRRLAGTPLLIVASYDATEVDDGHPLSRALRGFRGDPRFGALSLQPLDAAAHARLVEAVAAGRPVDPEVVRRIHELSEGNPLFVVETLRSLLDSGAHGEGPGLPLSAAQVVERRLERLTTEERQVLAAASVLGRSFEVRELEALLEESVLEPLLERLVERGLLVEELRSRGDRLSFASGLTREALHEALPTRRRRTLHRRHAEALERRHAASPRPVAHLLARHFAQGGVPGKAARYALQAAGSALQSAVAEDAVRFARAALAALGEDEAPDAALRAEAWLALARAQRLAGSVEEALQAAAEAAAAARQAGTTALLVRALLEGAETAWKDCRIEEARRLAEEGARSAADDPDAQTRFMLLAEQIADRHSVPATGPVVVPGSGRHWALGEPAALAQAEYLGLREALPAERRAGGASLAVRLLRMARLARQLGRAADAQQCLQEALGTPGLEAPLGADLECELAGLLLCLGRAGEAAECLCRARRLLDGAQPGEIGRRLLQAEIDLALARDDTPAASRAVLSLLADRGQGPAAVASLLSVAAARAAAGDRAAARAVLEEALADQASVERSDLVRAGLLRASMLLAEDDAPGALEQAEAALALAVELAEPWLLAAVRVALGQALLAEGEVEDAEEEYLRVLRDASRLGAAVQAFEAQLGLAAVNRERGRLLAAEVGARIALELGAELGPHLAASARLLLAEVLDAAGQTTEARGQLPLLPPARRSLRLLDRLGEPGELAEHLTRVDAGPRHRARIQLALARSAESRLALEEARQAARAALREALVAGAADLSSEAYLALAGLARAAGDAEAARRAAQAGIEAAEALGPRRQATAHLALAEAELASGDRRAAQQASDVAMQRLRAGGSAALAEGSLRWGSLLAQDEPEEAQRLLEQARHLAALAEYPEVEAHALGLLGELSLRAGRLSEAVEHLRSEAASRDLSGALAGLPGNRVRLARAYHAFGDLRQAAELLDEAVASGAGLPALVMRARVRRERAELRAAWIDLDAAGELCGPEPGERVLVQRERAEHLLAFGDVAGAARALERAREAGPGLSGPAAAALELTMARAALLAHRSQDALLLAGTTAESFRRQADPLGEAQARLVAAEAELLQGRDASPAIAAVVEQAAGLGVPLLRLDAVLLLARARRAPHLADEALRLATDLGSPLRVAVAARVSADAHARAGHAADAVRATSLATRTLARLRELLPDGARASGLLFLESRARPLVSRAG